MKGCFLPAGGAWLLPYDETYGIWRNQKLFLNYYYIIKFVCCRTAKSDCTVVTIVTVLIQTDQKATANTF